MNIDEIKSLYRNQEAAHGALLEANDRLDRNLFQPTLELARKKYEVITQTNRPSYHSGSCWTGRRFSDEIEFDEDKELFILHLEFYHGEGNWDRPDEWSGSEEDWDPWKVTIPASWLEDGFSWQQALGILKEEQEAKIRRKEDEKKAKLAREEREQEEADRITFQRLSQKFSQENSP